MSPPRTSAQSSASAHRCAEYELRFTRRCLEEDLDYYGEAPFEDLADHEIAKALIGRRSDGPTDTKRVSPLQSGKEVYRLAYGDRHRGATWYDEHQGVVWLVAYAKHEFEGRGDAFPYFKALDEEGRLLPGPADYEQLLSEQDERFGAEVAADAGRLLAEARQSPGREVAGVLGGTFEVTISIVVVEELEEICVAIVPFRVPEELFMMALAALFRGRDLEEIESAEAMPDRPLRDGELAFRALLD